MHDEISASYNDHIIEGSPIIIAPEQPGVIKTSYVEKIIKRALNYIRAGFPVHFSGPSGTGKTTMAMYVAGQLGRPVIIVHGDDEFGTSDLIGGVHGYRSKKVVDNFIHSVLKSEEDTISRWVDNRVTVACKHGFTLIYDEFTRSRPEANNVLLSILEEKILDLPAERGGQNYLRVHPEFSVIFTSNPQEYAGVHHAQDALKDRMITIDLTHYDRDTEIAITKKKSNISSQDAEKIVDIVRDFRKMDKRDLTPTIRACIMIARVLKLCHGRANAHDVDFRQACLDIINSEKGNGSKGISIEKTINELINKYCKSG